MFVRLAVAIACLASSSAWSQPDPAKPVKFVVPFAAGSATDIAARLIAEELLKSWEKHIKQAGIEPE